MVRALSVYQVLSAKKRTMPFDGEWLSVFGEPEMAKTWLIWGQSYSGKTTFVLQLCKYLCRFGRVAYNSLEEGSSRSMQIAFERVDMREVARRFVLLDGVDMTALGELLDKRKSPDIVVVDSVQYSDMNYASYKAFRDRHAGKLIICVSHAEGKLPEGRMANKIRYDAMVKIRVEGYRAYVNSRYAASEGSEKYITIWADGANRYWGPEQQNEDDEDDENK